MTDAKDDLELTEEQKAAIQDFLDGKVTLGELQGIDENSQLKVAKIGFDYIESGKYADAEVIFKGLIALNPYEAYNYVCLGSIAQRRNELEAAEGWYSRAIDCEGPQPIAHANRGEVRLMLERLEDAVGDLAQAIKQDPKFKEATTERARALLAEVSKQVN